MMLFWCCCVLVAGCYKLKTHSTQQLVYICTRMYTKKKCLPFTLSHPLSSDHPLTPHDEMPVVCGEMDGWVPCGGWMYIISTTAVVAAVPQVLLVLLVILRTLYQVSTAATSYQYSVGVRYYVLWITTNTCIRTSSLLALCVFGVWAI